MAKEEAIKLGVVTQLAKSSFMIPIRSGLQAVIGDLKRNIDCFLEEIDGSMKRRSYRHLNAC